MQNIIIKTFTVIFSALPLSLIIINRFSRFFSKHHPKIGETTTICTNVTGTLTEKDLIVRTFYFDKYKGKSRSKTRFLKIQDLQDQNQEPMTIDKEELKKDEVFRLIANTTFLCHFKKTATVEKTIEQLMLECGFGKHKAEDDYEILQKIPDNPEKKHSTIVAYKKDTGEIFAFTKGNAFHILKKCNKKMINGKKVELTDNMKRNIRKRIKRLNNNGQKVIAFAFKPLPLKRQDNYSEGFTESEMTFLGMAGITNPLKTDLQESIDKIKEAGIKTYILTGVKERKAGAIGKKQQLINPQYFEAVSGEYIRSQSDQKVLKMLSNKEKDYVFAELKKKDKARIIKLLRSQGDTVAVIDSKHKTSLNKTIDAIQRGRIITRNYRLYSHHAITCKVAELMLVITALALQAPLPFTIAMIVGVDLFINLILELALRVNRLEDHIMSPEFHPENTKTVHRKSLPGLLINSLSIGLITTLIYLASLFRYGWTIGEKLPPESAAATTAATITLVLLVLIQIANSFSLKNREKSFLQTSLLSNPYLLLTGLIGILLIYGVTIIPVTRDILGLNMISSLEWQIILFIVLIIILIEEVRKYFVRRSHANTKE